MKSQSTPGFKAALGIVEQVANHIQEQVVRGELKPGARIAEARITESLGVSRGSVREALRLLVARHLVEFVPRRGARVSPFDRRDVEGLYEVQTVLLTLLAQRIARRWQEGDKDRLLAYARDIDAAAKSGDAPQLLRLAQEFQHAACVVADNPYLTETLERLAPAFSRAHYRALGSGSAEQLGLAEFVSHIIAAALARDTALAAQIVDRYASHQRAVVLASFDAVGSET